MTQEPLIIKTILGSCVAVVLWDGNGKVAGMCHYLLPKSQQGANDTARYGNYAIDELVNRCITMGANKSTLRAFVYGGGSVVDRLSSNKNAIGEQNISCANEKLAEHGIRIEFSSTGGTSGRKISFDTVNGKVYEEVFNSKEQIELLPTPKGIAPEIIKVLIVDDSVTIRNILRSAFERNKRIQVIGTAVDPYDAREKIAALRPDVITLDIEMPRMNGIEFLEKLMEHLPIPTVIVSSLSSQGAAAVRALELGAVEFVHKPSQFDPSVLTEFAEILIPKVIAAAAFKPKAIVAKSKNVMGQTSDKNQQRTAKLSAINAIVMGGNAGSSDSLLHVLSTLPEDTPPIFVSISTIAGFADNWIQKVNKVKTLPVVLQIATEDSIVRNGCVYIATKEHLQVFGNGRNVNLKYLKAPPASGQKPSSDILFSSAATVFGKSVIGILLSGYGNDGVSGLMSIKDAGGVTIVQDPNDCQFNYNVVSALNEGLADFVDTQVSISQRIDEIRSRFVA